MAADGVTYACPVRFGDLRKHLLVVPLVVLGALAPLVVSATVFPDLTVVVDEVAYLSQAEAMTTGQLTLPTADFVPHFRPQLSGTHADRVVFKYQPTWPAFLALSRKLTGSYRPALAVVGAAAVLTMYAFSYELLRRRRTALLATTAFVASPFVIIQSGTHLAYLPTLPLLLGSAACLLRGTRTGHRWLFVAAGALIGVAFLHRAFDAILWMVPLAGYLALRTRADGSPDPSGDPAAAPPEAAVPDPPARLPIGSFARQMLRWGGLVAVGALPFVGLYLAYNAVVMDSPLTPAFSASGSLDTFGFGRRSSFDFAGPEVGTFNFTPGQAWHTVSASTGRLPDWLFGWYLGLALAVTGLVLNRRERTTKLLVVLMLAFPLGYFFWWGAANAIKFGLHQVLGPFYWLPSLVPMAVLTGLGIEAVVSRAPARLARTGPALTAMALVIMAVVPMWRMWPDVNESADSRSVTARANRAPVGGRTLLLALPSFKGDPYVPEIVPGDLDDAERLVALSTGTDRLELLVEHDDRRVFEQRRRHPADGVFEPTRRSTVELRLERTARFVIPLDVTATQDVDRAVAALEVDDQRLESDLGPMRAGERRSVRFAVSADGDGTSDQADEIVWSTDGASTIRAGVSFTGPFGSSADIYELRWEARRTSSGPSPTLEIVVPPSTWHRYSFPDGSKAWSEEIVDPVLSGT